MSCYLLSMLGSNTLSIAVCSIGYISMLENKMVKKMLDGNLHLNESTLMQILLSSDWPTWPVRKRNRKGDISILITSDQYFVL